MPAPSAAFLNRRENDRIAIKLNCLVTFHDKTAHATTVNLSFGGACVAMPLHAGAYDFKNLTTLHIRGVGLVRVVHKWSQDRNVGMEFINPMMVRQSMARLFTQNGASQPIRMIGG